MEMTDDQFVERLKKINMATRQNKLWVGRMKIHKLCELGLVNQVKLFHACGKEIREIVPEIVRYHNFVFKTYGVGETITQIEMEEFLTDLTIVEDDNLIRCREFLIDMNATLHKFFVTYLLKRKGNGSDLRRRFFELRKKSERLRKKYLGISQREFLFAVRGER